MKTTPKRLPTFFAPTAAIFINTGYEGLKAAAIAITDAALGGFNEKVIKRIFSLKPQLLQLFPHFAHIEFKKIAKAPLEIAQFVIPLTDALRQIAVDEMVGDPTKYRSAFFSNHRIITPKELRKPDTWVDHTAIKALSAALSLPIKIQTEEIIYQSVTYHPPYPLSKKIILKSQAGYYFPKVSTDVYRLVNSDSLKFPKVDSENAPDLSEAELREILEKDDKDKRLEHANLFNILTNLVDQGEIDLQQLIFAYIKTIEKNDPPESSMQDPNALTSPLPLKEYEKHKIISGIVSVLVSFPEKRNIFFQSIDKFIEESAKSPAKLRG